MKLAGAVAAVALTTGCLDTVSGGQAAFALRVLADMLNTDVLVSQGVAENVNGEIRLTLFADRAACTAVPTVRACAGIDPVARTITFPSGARVPIPRTVDLTKGYMTYPEFKPLYDTALRLEQRQRLQSDDNDSDGGNSGGGGGDSGGGDGELD